MSIKIKVIIIIKEIIIIVKIKVTKIILIMKIISGKDSGMVEHDEAR